jgi:intracellular septation protein A
MNLFINWIKASFVFKKKKKKKLLKNKLKKNYHLPQENWYSD